MVDRKRPHLCLSLCCSHSLNLSVSLFLSLTHTFVFLLFCLVSSHLFPDTSIQLFIVCLFLFFFRCLFILAVSAVSAKRFLDSMPLLPLPHRLRPLFLAIFLQSLVIGALGRMLSVRPSLRILTVFLHKVCQIAGGVYRPLVRIHSVLL